MASLIPGKQLLASDLPPGRDPALGDALATAIGKTQRKGASEKGTLEGPGISRRQRKGSLTVSPLSTRVFSSHQFE